MSPTAVVARRTAEGRLALLRRPLLAAGVVLGLSLALHFRDPHQSGSWGFCPFRETTGFDCPGCGGLRAVNDLSDLHVGAALSSNLLFVASIPMIVGGWLWWLGRSWSGRPTRPPPHVVRAITSVYIVLAVVFVVVRNTPWGHWLHS